MPYDGLVAGHGGYGFFGAPAVSSYSFGAGVFPPPPVFPPKPPMKKK